jgi:hypothetical protein
MSDDPLVEAMGLEPVPVVRTEPTVPAPLTADEDYEFARKNMFRLVAKVEDQLDQLADIAQTSQHPRAYEVYSGLAKTLLDVNKELMGIKKTQKEISNESGPRVQNNTLMVTTEEMLERFKDAGGKR